MVRSSSIHFAVHPQMDELQAYAQERGWLDRGFSTLSVPWLELHWTADAWKTVNVLRSTDVPCPIVDGNFLLPNVKPETLIEFAVHVGLACHAPQDTAGVRESGELWLNNGGANYRQAAA
jgi:hypothetical protein